MAADGESTFYCPTVYPHLILIKPWQNRLWKHFIKHHFPGQIHEAASFNESDKCWPEAGEIEKQQSIDGHITLKKKYHMLSSKSYGNSENKTWRENEIHDNLR